MTADIVKLREIQVRVRAATGPDREIDCLIWAEIHDRDVRYESDHLLARNRRPPHDECWLGPIGGVARNFLVTSGFEPPIPEYTSSIDDAMALIERVLPLHDVQTNVRHSTDGPRYTAEVGDRPEVCGATLPLALLEGMLAALIAIEERAGHGESGG